MSLLDFRHLVAPFKNTVHLVSIVFIVLLFAVYRLATGGVGIESAPVPRLASQVAQPVASPAPQQNTGLENNIQRLLTGGKANQQNAADPQPVKDGADLQEIERALGLSQ